MSLKPIIENHYKIIADCINDPEFNKFLLQGWKPVNANDIKLQFEHETEFEKALHYAIYNKNNEFVGWGGLFNLEPITRKAELRAFILKKYWSKGYGLALHKMLIDIGFQKLNLNKIYCGTNEKNEGVLKIYEKLGLKKEGTLRQEYYRNSTYYDAYRFSILGNEYWSKNENPS